MKTKTKYSLMIIPVMILCMNKNIEAQNDLAKTSFNQEINNDAKPHTEFQNEKTINVLEAEVAELKAEMQMLKSNLNISIQAVEGTNHALTVRMKPFEYKLSVKARLPESSLDGELNISNNDGRIVFSRNNLRDLEQVEANTAMWTPGNYFAELYIDGTLIESEKFVIKK
ncbi:MAG: hypothetical protein ABIS37_05775 [Bacteroidia bacterium]